MERGKERLPVREKETHTKKGGRTERSGEGDNKEGRGRTEEEKVEKELYRDRPSLHQVKNDKNKNERSKAYAEPRCKNDNVSTVLIRDYKEEIKHPTQSKQEKIETCEWVKKKSRA